MFWQIFLSIIAFSLAVKASFTEPSGGDGSTTYEVGQIANIAWNGTSTYSILSLGIYQTTNKTITWLISNSVSYPTHCQWTVALDGFNLTSSNIFRFYIVNGTEFESPIYSPWVIIEEPSSSSTTSSIGTSTTATATAISKTSTSTSSSAETTQSTTSSGLSTGAIAGIGAGAGVAGILALAALAWWIIRRRRKGASMSPSQPESAPLYEAPSKRPPQLIDSKERNPISELPTTQYR